jgi:predicted polyphosphate/ATP-dependent NAD kinase
MTMKIGFIINPIAGMGGKVGLKGTDGVIKRAINLGAQPIALEKARETLTEFIRNITSDKPVDWYTCSGEMGEKVLKNSSIANQHIIYRFGGRETTAKDTKNACKEFLKVPVDLVLFCGGDGTARDIFSIIGKNIPLLGIPSGVKMHSGVFGITTDATAKMLHEFIDGRLTIGDVEIMDLDETRYRKGEWNIKLFGIAQGIIEPTYIQVGKASFESLDENVIRDELAEHIADEMDAHADRLFLFGSGGTIEYIAKKIGVTNTLLGIDAVYQKKVVGEDLNEKQLLELLTMYPRVKLILSPIGAQGFILGRGNLQLSPKVIRKIGIDNIIIVSTPAKIAATPFIRVDTGDKKLDAAFKKHEFFMVVIGYRLSRVVKIQTNNF